MTKINVVTCNRIWMHRPHVGVKITSVPSSGAKAKGRDPTIWDDALHIVLGCKDAVSEMADILYLN